MPPAEEREVAREAIRSLSRDDLKDAVKSAIKECIREQVTEFGWWTLKGAAVMTIGVIVYFALTIKGWRFGP